MTNLAETHDYNLEAHLEYAERAVRRIIHVLRRSGVTFINAS